MTFEYLRTESFMDSIDIEDLGNFCLDMYNDLGKEWFLLCETKLGRTVLKSVGPFDVDKPNYIDDNFYYSRNEFEYNEKKISSIVKESINNYKKCITQAFLVDKEEMLAKFNKAKF